MTSSVKEPSPSDRKPQEGKVLKPKGLNGRDTQKIAAKVAPQNLNGVTSTFEELIGDFSVDNAYRQHHLSLTASENYPSKAVRILGSAMQGGFYEFTPPYETQPGEWFFPDSGIAKSLTAKLSGLGQELFHGQSFDWRPNGGSAAEQSIMLGCCPRGTGIVHFAHKDGGHFALDSLADAIGVKVYAIPMLDRTQLIDVDRLTQMVRDHPEIRLVMLDQSFKLRWQPLAEIRASLPENVVLAYDASHDGALIIGGQIPQPLLTGADIIHGNTHKTIPGPQKGYISFKSKDHPNFRNVADWLCPKLQSNSHAECIAPMYMAFKEMAHFGPDYGAAITLNAKALAKALVAEGFKVSGEAFGYTETHQVHVILGSYEKALEAVTKLLPRAGIRATNIEIPGSNGNYGLRLGTQSFTRRGATPEAMEEIAKLLARVLLLDHEPETVREEISFIMKEYPLGTLHYSFDSILHSEVGNQLLKELLA